eukprot:TRINITY_DN5911_c0_g1_i1.p2 TRINITY_DN5911_c0_g1~~TRINITY_DN5911_c0_g1_i1.p2  ORF type:complete len:119 (+),score=3.55 TRINITY_DN5911_c0_g1_i1:3-359(+)
MPNSKTKQNRTKKKDQKEKFKTMQTLLHASLHSFHFFFSSGEREINFRSQLSLSQTISTNALLFCCCLYCGVWSWWYFASGRWGNFRRHDILHFSKFVHPSVVMCLLFFLFCLLFLRV